MVARGNPGLDKVNDINVICGVLKDFFIKLREPLLTFKLHQTFLKAAGNFGRLSLHSHVYSN